MRRWSELAPPSTRYVQSRSLPEVHSCLAKEPKTTRLVSSDAYFGMLAESSRSSSSRFSREVSRHFCSIPELRKCVAAVGRVSGIEHHSSKVMIPDSLQNKGVPQKHPPI